MNYALGDSHSSTFAGLSNPIGCLNFGAISMFRVVHDVIVEEHIGHFLRTGELSRDGMWIFCFGDNDVRCHIHKQITEKMRNEDEVIERLVTEYVGKARTLHHPIAIMSVVPPFQMDARKEEFLNNLSLPWMKDVRGSDVERSRYVAKINDLMKSECAKYGVLYLDVYGAYKDGNGMLPIDVSDGNVHILNRGKVEVILRELGLV